MIPYNTTIGIIGGGKMGTSLFNFLSQLNLKLVWVIRSAYEEKNNRHSRKLQRALKTGIISEEEYKLKRKNQLITQSLNELKAARLVIECIDENLESKQGLIKHLFKILPSSAIIASNSSSILPEKLGKTAQNKGRIIGLHFFYPLELKETVELVQNEYNSKETVGFTEAYLKTIKKQAFIQKGETRFMLNRLMLDWQAAAFNYSVKNNYTFNAIDMAVENHFPASAIFKTMDAIGLEIIYFSAVNYQDFFKATNQESLLTYLTDCLLQTQVGFYSKSEQDAVKPKYNQELKTIAVELAFEFKAILNKWAQEFNIPINTLEKYMNEYFETEIARWPNSLQ